MTFNYLFFLFKYCFIDQTIIYNINKGIVIGKDIMKITNNMSNSKKSVIRIHPTKYTIIIIIDIIVIAIRNKNNSIVLFTLYNNRF